MKVTNRDRACCMCVRFLLFIISHSDSSSTFFFIILLWALSPSLCSFLHIFFRVVLLKIKNYDFHLHHESLLFTCLHSLFGLLYVRLAAAVLCAKEGTRRREDDVYYIKLETAKTPKREPEQRSFFSWLLYFWWTKNSIILCWSENIHEACSIIMLGKHVVVECVVINWKWIWRVRYIFSLKVSLPPSRLGGDQSTRMLLFRFPLLPIPFENLRFCVCWFDQLIHFPRHK